MAGRPVPNSLKGTAPPHEPRVKPPAFTHINAGGLPCYSTGRASGIGGATQGGGVVGGGAAPIYLLHDWNKRAGAATGSPWPQLPRVRSAERTRKPLRRRLSRESRHGDPRSNRSELWRYVAPLSPYPDPRI
jgi:hypothetical protein